MEPRIKVKVTRRAALFLICASCAIGSAQESSQLFGKGSFMFEPLDGKPVRLYYYVPPTATPESPVVIVCHGLSRNADDYRDRWMNRAFRYKLIIAAPEFSADVFPGSRGYNLGNVFRDGERPRRHELNEEGEWTFSAIEPIFDEIKRRTGNNTERYYIFGHSAGGQFVHRLLLFKPVGRYAALVAANSGWYTVPDETVTFPYGLRSTPVAENDFAFFAQPLIVMVGTQDNDPNARNLRHAEGAERQGPHRYARAHYFYRQSRAKAESLGTEFAWEIVDVSGVGHSGSLMSKYAADHLFRGDR
jgi:poly(3-hydroxybutyrate) depolymerase